MYNVILNENQKKIFEEASEFVKSVDKQLLIDMDADLIEYPRQTIKKLGDLNLLGIRFEKEFGGRNLSWQEEVVLIEEIGILGAALSCASVMPSIVGEAISKFGSNYQKEKYLKPTLKGDLICAEGLTEPRGGSDFFGATTIAKKDGNKWILNGQKRFIVGAKGADYFLIYAKTNFSNDYKQNMSAFLVDKNQVSVENLYELMGARGAGTGRIVLKNAIVGEENLIGKENEGSKIFYQMMIPERLTTAAGALGIAKASLEIALSYSKNRKAFGQPIKNFEAVSFKIAQSSALLDAARSLVHTAAKAVDELQDSSIQRRLVSEAKRFSTQAAWEIVNNAMQIMGGIGYTNVYPVERYLRDTRLMMIWTGTNEIMDLIVQHELYKELDKMRIKRDIENDAKSSDKIEEKVFE
ncbi:acyl-CoA dehydrogenase family protein [Desulfurella multipotens]|uniref:acyl-CoA dehydrogenase family protein n=1 Tax=Desulfurella TaxID=33001 RepID=UPI0003E0982F|nr:acyl-CoA dehydrogenase family protein [Desulfurella multipotens]AHF96993.1 acyl-CoA dehydrogenase [Desulfurella acetivorans A63]PMP67368.1 MAG: acyl-CoA dehydrogenase [Desulfurella multipotens]